MRLLAGQVSERELLLLGMAYGSIRRRVADMLLRMQASGAPEAAIQLTRDDLPAVVGTAPESLIRVLSEFKQDGLIEQTSAGIRVVQPEKRRRAHW